MRCYHCGSEIEVAGIPTRRELCPQCSAFLHCCLNCDFYDPNAHHQCREPQAEWVQDKQAGNFCTYFRPGTESTPISASDRQAEARKKLDQLFKKK